MAWSAPMTAVANTVFTAAQFNTYVRDNFNETAPAKATAAGQFFVSVAANSIAARTPVTANVDTSQSTTSNTYTNLATVGPAVTVTTGTAAFVMLCAGIQDGTVAQIAYMSYEITGASSQSADDSVSLQGGNSYIAASIIFLQGLTPGSNVFTCKYRTSGGTTGTYLWRKISVLPF